MSEQQLAPSPSQQRKPSWLVSLCRKLLRVLRVFWGFLVFGVGGGTLANLSTTTIDTPPSHLFIVHLALVFPFPVFSSLGFLALLTLLCWIGGLEHTPAVPHVLSERNRTYMLQRLRLRYEQMIAQSLQGATQIELGMSSRPEAVQNTVSLSLRLPNQSGHLLPTSTSIIQAYELAQQELLILGEPGAGKSTFLLELAYHLAQQAEQNITQPLPILLPLSSWAVSRRPLHEWLSEQVAFLYNVPRSLSLQWIQSEFILPLLDGLDEMEASAQTACIAAINTYHSSHLQPLVVCSRTNAYMKAAPHERLTLHMAVIIQPLSAEQINTHLMSVDKPLAALRTTLRKNHTLQAMATTPLMLQMLILTYYNTSVRNLSHKQAQLRQQLWADYIRRMIDQKGDAKRYPFNTTCIWLAWLARQMRAQNQTIFFLEHLQPDWLPAKRRGFYQWSVRLLLGLFFGLSSLIVGWLLFRLLCWFFPGLLFGLFFEQLLELDTEIVPTEVLTWSWKKARVSVIVGLLFSFTVGVFFRSVSWLLVGLGVGLLFGLILGVSENQLTERSTLSPNEGIWRSIKNGLLFGLITGLIIGLISGLFFGLLFGILFGLIIGILVGGFIGVLCGLIFGLDAALRHYVLRFWFRGSHNFPLDALPFLEDAAMRILLQRVGGGYSFTHHLLLDYFADLDMDTLPV